MFSGKKLFLLGFIVILLIGIPLTVYLVQQQQDGRSRADASTTLTFTPATTTAAPKDVKVGETVPLDITVDPGSNKVNQIQLVIQYDPSKLEPASTDAFVPNTTAFPTTIEGPISTPGRFAITLSIGSDATKVIQTPTKLGTISLKAIAPSETNPVTVLFGPETKVTSVAGPATGSNDQSAENVLQAANPAFIRTLADLASNPTATLPPSQAPSPSPTLIAQAPSATPTLPAATKAPTPTVAVATPTPLPTSAPVVTAEPTVAPTLAPTGPGDTIVGAGALAAVVTLVGAVIFFAL